MLYEHPMVSPCNCTAPCASVSLRARCQVGGRVCLEGHFNVPDIIGLPTVVRITLIQFALNLSPTNNIIGFQRAFLRCL